MPSLTHGQRMAIRAALTAEPPTANCLQLARRFGVTHMTVYWFAKSHGLPLVPRGRPVDPNSARQQRLRRSHKSCTV